MHDPPRPCGVGIRLPLRLALPAAFLIAWWGFTNADRYLSVVLFLVPLSVNLSEFGLTSIGWYMPTEPMLFALMLLFAARWVSGQTLPIANFATPDDVGDWLGLCVDGIHHFAQFGHGGFAEGLDIGAWFIVSFYVMVGEWVRVDPRAKARFLALLAIPLCGVIAYARSARQPWIQQAGRPLGDEALFQRPHLIQRCPCHDASAGHCHGMARQSILPCKRAVDHVHRLAGAGHHLLVHQGGVGGLAAAGVLWLLMLAGVRFKALLVGGLGAMVVLAFSWDSLVIQLERNKQDSSDDLAKHVESISNVSSDVNLEKLNRWSCA